MHFKMDWRCYGALIISITLFPFSSAWSVVDHNSLKGGRQQQNEVSPYIDLIICPIREEPWSCARQQSARILDIWDNEVHLQWKKLKVEADRQLNATMERRGYSASEVLTKEKPSSILKKIEIGTNFMKEYLAETMDGFLGREYEYMKSSGKSDTDADSDTENDNDNDTEDTDNDNDDDNDADTDTDTDEDEQTENESSSEDDTSKNTDKETSQETDNETDNNGGDLDGDTDNNAEAAAVSENTSNGVEFIEIEDSERNPVGQLKRPDGKKKKKKKGQASNAPATVLVVQQQPAIHTDTESHGHHGDGGFDGGHGHGHGGGGGGKPLKQKRKKRKKHQHGGHGGESVVVVEEESAGDHHLGLGLLEELVNVDDLLDAGGDKRKKKHPSKYGRSNGVTRGKKKKKKKALMKLVLLGSFLKAKIELLLKILGAHLQIKFFAIALIGLLINIARFWIDVKRGGSPQKVVYVEHAHHQHHYEDHGDDWSEQGSYWKRSLQTDPTIEEDTYTDASYQIKPQQTHQQYQQQQPQDAHYMAYRGQWQ